MSCNIKINTLNLLREKGVINEKNEVIKLTDFNKLNKLLSQTVFNTYGIGNNKTMLFKVVSEYKVQNKKVRSVLKAIPNLDIFNILDKAPDTLDDESLSIKDLTKEKELVLNNDLNEKLIIDKNTSTQYSKNLSTVNEFILLNNTYDQQYKATEILDNIILNYDNFSEDSKILLEKAKILLKSTDATVMFIDKDTMGEGTFMRYVPSINSIQINLNTIRSSSTDFVIHGFLHEVVHSVTVQSYLRPISLEQNMFKDFIDEAFEFYKNESYYRDYYGFSEPVEFIAEIFTNIQFQKEIKKIDKKYTNKSFFKKLTDFIRIVFGLKKNLTIDNKKINFNNLIESIVDVSKSNNTDLLSKLLATKSFAIKVDPSKLNTDFTTLDNKLDNSIDKIQDSIKSNINNYKFLTKVIKDKGKVENIEKYIESLEQLKIKIKSFSKENKIKAVSTFVKKMASSMEYVKNQLDNIDYDNQEQVMNTVKVYNNYLNTYSVVNELQKLLTDIREDRSQTVVEPEELNEIEEQVISAKGQFSFLEERIYSIMKNGMSVYLNDIKYFPQIEKKHRDRLYKEHRQSQIPQDKETWVAKQLQNRDKELVQEDLTKKIDELINNPSFDIYAADVTMSSAINVSSTLIQIMNQMLFEIDNRRIEVERKKDVEFKNLFDELVKSKGTNDIKKLYSNILDFDKDGKPYLKGKYKIDFYTDVHKKINDIRNEYRELVKSKKEELVKVKNLVGEQDPSYSAIQRDIKELVKKRVQLIKKIEKENFEKNSKGKITKIKDKWLNDNSSLSETEEKVRDFFEGILETSSKNTYSQDSLITYSYGTKFYELPKITKSDTERIWTDLNVDIVKDKWTDLTTVRPDDVGYSSKNTDLENNEINKLRIHYRDRGGKFDNKQQSLDLMTVMRLEYKNGNMYKVRKDTELELKFLLDIAKNKKYYQKEGTQKVLNLRSKKLNIVEGKDTNTFKMMSNIMESRFYDMMNKNSVKLGSVDLNKAVQFINNTSGFLTLSLNIASGTANVVNANAQVFLESFLKGQFIKAKSVAKANKIYAANMADNIKDIRNPINTSFVNQVNEIFNIRGLFNLSDANFLKSDLIKAGLNTESLQVFQDSGEHWIQSTISMAVLDGIKVMDANNNYINKIGKIVSDKNKAASLLDMMIQDKDTGLVTVSDKVVYTTHSRVSKWNEGGKEKVDMLIKKKLYDSIGNYTETDQPDIMRHWYGKLLMLYRKYLVPMGQSRLRGIEYAFRSKENMTDDEKRFSYALQEDEEGTYVSLIRYFAQSIKDKKFYILSKSNWNKLSDYEKHNIKRSVVEIIMTSVVLPLVTTLVKSIAANDDDDYIFFLAYQLRRLETELSQYRDLGESFKMMRSPIPSARLLETGSSIIMDVFNPFKWDETYKSGHNKGKNKLKTRILKQLPVVKEFQRTYEDLFEYQQSSWGTGL